MSVRYVLAPEAVLDLVEVWHYIREQTNTAIADHVESVIRDRIGFLAQAPGAGHMRQDLTNEDVKFFPVYSYLSYIVPRPNLSTSHAFCTVAGTWNKSSKVGCEFCNKAGLGLPQSINSTISKLGLKAKSSVLAFPQDAA